MTTRRELLLLLRTRPGLTAAEAAEALSLSTAAVRRHLDQLASDGLVERTHTSSSPGVGRPPSGWRLSRAGLELFPRRYEDFAIDLLDDLAEEVGPETVDAVLARRTDKLVASYRAELDGLATAGDRVRRVAELRDEAGYAAECHPNEDGEVLLVEKNCAVHRIAEQHGTVCAQELTLLERVLGPENEVTRISHTMAGDPVCCYRVRPRPPEDGRL
ncbi:MAG: helix-turn-helix domain-containing protein [Actinomycetota bacterium]|nr:helix-turn-helix domain-containing protein [Actinomycetota bacterium]